MKILFVGVFDLYGKSTNNSQIISLKTLGHKVTGYNYRKKAKSIGTAARDLDLIGVLQNRSFDLVLFSKCNQISSKVFTEAKKKSKTCLWFMDPLSSYNSEMREKTDLVDYFCCDKKNVLIEAIKLNCNAFHIHEGFDHRVDKPIDTKKEYEVSFIGNLYGMRRELIAGITKNVTVIDNAYGQRHPWVVSKTKINLNFCTDEGASDRVYKILAAGGFLLTNDWHGRQEVFQNHRDLVIYTDLGDLNEKIEFYLENDKERALIAKSGNQRVQRFNRLHWAQKIVENYDRLYR